MKLKGRTAADVAAAKRAADLEASIREGMDYLASTDWYVVRQVERGIAMPPDVRTMRAAACDVISKAREALKG